MNFPGHRLQCPPESCLGPSVTIYLLFCFITAQHFILVNITAFYQHFSKKSYAPQAIKRQKKPQIPKLRRLKLKRLTPTCSYIWAPETTKQQLPLKSLESSNISVTHQTRTSQVSHCDLFSRIVYFLMIVDQAQLELFTRLGEETLTVIKTF